MAELDRHGGLFDYASLFAYELDPGGRPIPAPGFQQVAARFKNVARSKGFKAWATVVNDVRHPDGSVRLKSADAVHAILSDPGRRADHARVLAEQIERDGFDGLHLDYERVAARDEDVFRAFVSLLDAELSRRGAELNVVLEPLRGPRPTPGTAGVTVMAYNEHGPHGGPGPRATPGFVSDLAPREGRNRYGSPTVALALAGFLWKDDGTVEPVDWDAARDATRETPPERGLFTRVPYARVAAGELWFEDPESLDAKWRAAHAAGFRGLALWRLGGNDERLFNWLHTLQHSNSTTRAANQ